MQSRRNASQQHHRQEQRRFQTTPLVTQTSRDRFGLVVGQFGRRRRNVETSGQLNFLSFLFIRVRSFSQIVASLTENVKKMDLLEQPKNDNKENRASKRPTSTNVVLRKKNANAAAGQPVEIFASELLSIELIEPPLNDESPATDDDGELIDPTYAMDYIAEIMNLLYALEKKYPLQSNFLSNPTSTTHPLTSMATMANGSATRPWKLTTKHRTVLVGWIIQLFYARFHLSQDALHM